jgi:hypothetical protein
MVAVLDVFELNFKWIKWVECQKIDKTNYKYKLHNSLRNWSFLKMGEIIYLYVLDDSSNNHSRYNFSSLPTRKIALALIQGPFISKIDSNHFNFIPGR